MISILHNWQTGKMDWKKPPERWFSSFFFFVSKTQTYSESMSSARDFLNSVLNFLKASSYCCFCGSGLWIPTVFFFLYKTDLDQSDKKNWNFFLTDESECRTHMEYWHSFEILSDWWKIFHVPVFLHLYEQTIKNIPRTVGNSGICIHRAQRRNLGISMMQNNSGLFITIAIWWWVIFTAPMSPAASQMF